MHMRVNPEQAARMVRGDWITIGRDLALRDHRWPVGLGGARVERRCRMPRRVTDSRFSVWPGRRAEHEHAIAIDRRMGSAEAKPFR